MDLQLIRNATMRLTYGAHTLLTDPFFSPRHAIRSFGGREKNPIVDLPLSAAEIVRGVDALLISHLHPDHWDAPAAAALSAALPTFCQPGDEDRLRADGREDVRPVADVAYWNGLQFRRTPGRHGYGETAARMGAVSGFVLRAPGEPVVYWCGDTVWYEAVADVIRREQPDVIVTHSAGARFGDDAPIIMDAGQTVSLCQAAPNALVVAVHMESVDHGTVSRADLRAAADAAGIPPQRLSIPLDGDLLALQI